MNILKGSIFLTDSVDVINSTLLDNTFIIINMDEEDILIDSPEIVIGIYLLPLIAAMI